MCPEQSDTTPRRANRTINDKTVSKLSTLNFIWYERSLRTYIVPFALRNLGTKDYEKTVKTLFNLNDNVNLYCFPCRLKGS